MLVHPAQHLDLLAEVEQPPSQLLVLLRLLRRLQPQRDHLLHEHAAVGAGADLQHLLHRGVVLQRQLRQARVLVAQRLVQLRRLPHPRSHRVRVGPQLAVLLGQPTILLLDPSQLL